MLTGAGTVRDATHLNVATAVRVCRGKWAGKHGVSVAFVKTKC